MSFIDQARISVKAGSGGNGCTSFFRTKFTKWGKPDGGEGGEGGDIMMRASRHIHTLLDFQYNRHFKAESGTHGSSNHKAGRRGKDCLIQVPCGTIIKDASNGLVLRDLVNPEDSVIIAKGGKGGRGNTKGREGTPGDLGEEKDLLLELKLIADVGIIGYPNAGKSTFISAVSHAKSKIAGYPFTTKSPILGMVTYDDDVLTFADMPGLIEGAHSGRGLGTKFLKHIERTKILLHMVDVSCEERPDPYDDIISINKELELYDKELLNKKKIVVLSKLDVDGAKEKAEEVRNKLDEIVFPVSCVTGEGVQELVKYIFEISRESNNLK